MADANRIIRELPTPPLRCIEDGSVLYSTAVMAITNYLKFVEEMKRQEADEATRLEIQRQNRIQNREGKKRKRQRRRLLQQQYRHQQQQLQLEQQQIQQEVLQHHQQQQNQQQQHQQQLQFDHALFDMVNWF